MIEIIKEFFLDVWEIIKGNYTETKQELRREIEELRHDLKKTAEMKVDEITKELKDEVTDSPVFSNDDSLI